MKKNRKYLMLAAILIVILTFFLFDMYQFAKGVENEMDRDNKFKDSTNNMIFYKDSIGNYKRIHKDSLRVIKE